MCTIGHERLAAGLGTTVYDDSSRSSIPWDDVDGPLARRGGFYGQMVTEPDGERVLQITSEESLAELKRTLSAAS